MKLTGRAKVDFEKWYRLEYSKNKDSNLIHPLTAFKYFHLSMQWGVIVDWADSVGYIIAVFEFDQKRWEFVISYNNYNDYESSDIFNTRQEAREESIKKLNEIYNEKQTLLTFSK